MIQITQYSREEHEDFIRKILVDLFKKHISSFEPQKKTYFLTRKEVCALLSISYVTLSAWGKSGILTPYKIGNRVRFKSSEVESALVKQFNK